MSVFPSVRPDPTIDADTRTSQNERVALPVPQEIGQVRRGFRQRQLA